MPAVEERLRGSGVLVTGGGTGIGAACAARLAAEGAVVMICGRTESRLEAVVADLARAGLTANYTVADVTQEADVARTIERTVQAAGNLKGVVANAGGGGALVPYHLQDADEFMRVLTLNVLGTMLCVKHAVPHLVAAGGGSFVGMSSLAGAVTHMAFGAYPVAKAGIDHMMRNAADEYGPAGMEGIPRDSSVFESYIVNTPLGGTSTPEEVASVVSFLIGPDSARVTGQVIAIDGGQHLRAGPDFRPFTGLSADQLLAREDHPA
jgi:NAD(P)-dependent dehydrogenase (short-subunit alcohol dehydrogenase family)